MQSSGSSSDSTHSSTEGHNTPSSSDGDGKLPSNSDENPTGKIKYGPSQFLRSNPPWKLCKHGEWVHLLLRLDSISLTQVSVNIQGKQSNSGAFTELSSRFQEHWGKWSLISSITNVRLTKVSHPTNPLLRLPF